MELSELIIHYGIWNIIHNLLWVVGIKGGDALKEEWKQIPNFSDYKVSDRGRIKCERTGKGRILPLSFPLTDKDPYITIPLLNDDGKKEFIRVHRLVAELFIGEIPNGYHIHHKNGIKTDNRVDNLEIISAKEHYIESVALGQTNTKGMNDYNQFKRPKKIEQYTKDGQLLATYCNAAFAESCTGVCQRNILQVANGDEKRKQAGGFVWKFADERKGVILK